MHTRFVSLIALSSTALAAFADPPPGPDALTEFAAGNWSAAAEFATASVANDTSRVQVGGSSLRFNTTGGFDTWLWSPPGQNANWDFVAAGSGGIGFWVYAENLNIGFQNGSPWVRLFSSPGNYIELRSTNDILNEARNQWRYLSIPFSGNASWARTVVGAPSLASIDYIEIHADTWDAGFTLWFDGLDLTLPPPPPDGLVAYAGNARVALAWAQYNDPTGQFAHYAVYRRTSAFTSTVGLTPIATIANIAQTTFEDTTAVNGTRYHYAVTAVFNGGAETTQVQSLGPRTPRDETDLQVVSISRTPRYPRYDPTYTVHTVTDPSGFGPYVFTSATGLGSGQTPGTQRWPNIGDNVSYTATVRNRGTNAWAGTLAGTWTVDGGVVGTPSQAVNLQPGQTATFAIVRPWDAAAHDVGFVLNTVDGRATNNALEINTKSVAFLSYIDRTYFENFREQTPSYPNAYSDDFIDWLNNHMARFNELFEQAGTAKRIHFDVLEVLADSAPNPNVPRINFAIFPFRYLAADGTLRLSGYYHPEDDIDYGLLHEMGHQLGLIDIYRLNVDPAQNQVTSTGYSSIPCLMNGVSTLISQHSADAMTRWLNIAHGYYGQYLYALPQTVRLRILGRDGQPLSNAIVTIYQKCERPGQGEVITSQVKAQGATDAAGIYTLPNVPINPTLVPTTTAGDTLPANPFGYVAVVGTNGVFLIKVEHQGFVDYAWLDITEVNDAYNSGQTSVATFDRTVSLGGPIQYFPPADMAESNADSWVVWAQTGNISINDDAAQRIVGAASVRIDTDSGFDTYARYPGDRVAAWDLSGATSLRFWARAINNNQPQFQGGSPWIRLGHPSGYIELHPTSDVLNQAIGSWRQFTVPLNGNATWVRSVSGSPNIAAISHVEFHADTWGAGFTLWLDGVTFNPNPTPDPGDVNCDARIDFFDIEPFLLALFDPAAYAAALPDCNLLTADTNGDGQVNFFDIDSFVALLFP